MLHVHVHVALYLSVKCPEKGGHLATDTTFRRSHALSDRFRHVSRDMYSTCTVKPDKATTCPRSKTRTIKGMLFPVK